MEILQLHSDISHHLRDLLKVLGVTIRELRQMLDRRGDGVAQL